MDVFTVDAAKLAIVAATGLSKDTLHVYVGMAIFLGVAGLARRPLRSLVPWLAVLVVTCVGEVVDMRHNLAMHGSLLWQGSVHDLFNTLFWPTVMLMLARCTRMLESLGKGNA